MSEDLERIERKMAALGVRILPKSSSWHQLAIDRFLRRVTFGRMSTYRSRYVTTIGRMIYVPDDWDAWPAEARVDTLRHELVHVAQFARYGFVSMVLAYLLVPFPIGVAWCRMRLEQEAYAETLRAAYERGGRALAEAQRAHVKRRFVGPDYLWMWPFPAAIDRWFDRTLDEVARTTDPRL